MKRADWRAAVAGLCPITEANLGDGIFRGHIFREEGGRVGIGSDSNVLISLSGELRQLEYSQRLARQARNVLAAPGESTGRHLLESAVRGGAWRWNQIVALRYTTLPIMTEAASRRLLASASLGLREAFIGRKDATLEEVLDAYATAIKPTPPAARISKRQRPE